MNCPLKGVNFKLNFVFTLVQLFARLPHPPPPWAGDKYHENYYIIDFVIHFFNSIVLFQLCSERKKHSLEAGRSESMWNIKCTKI
jgi:hypothetical protein